MKIKWKDYENLDKDLTQIISVLEAVSEASYAPCAMRLEHEDAIWMCTERLRKRRDKLRKMVKRG